MEARILESLERTHCSDDALRNQAERELLNIYGSTAFPKALCDIAANDAGVSLPIRQSALLALKNYVLAGWSDSLDEFKGHVLIDDASKAVVRNALLQLATSEIADRKIQNAASYVVSKIASSDYPDEWPDLLPTLLQTIGYAGDNSIHGALKVLAELVEDGFNEDQFFKIAEDLVNILYTVSVDERKPLALKALAVSVFRGCFDILEMILEDYKAAVKTFAESAVAKWMPFFQKTLESRLPEAGTNDVTYKGAVTLKLQVMKTLMRVRLLFPAIIAPQTPALFSATWDELTNVRPSYQKAYLDASEEGRLEDSDGLPYTLDFLVLEDLDFLHACVKAPPVRKALEAQLKEGKTWLLDLVNLIIAYAQITDEEEGMWDIDVNVFLAEETSVTANYTSRTACGDMAVKLGEWLPDSTMQALLAAMKQDLGSGSGWRLREASLFILGQILADWSNLPRTLQDDLAQGLHEIIRYSITQPEPFLRARGFLLAGLLAKTVKPPLHQLVAPLLEATLHSAVHDENDIVKVSCIRAVGQYLQAFPPSMTHPIQASIITTLGSWLRAQDPADLPDADDLVITFLDTLKDALLLDTQICITGDGLNLLFNMASSGASNLQIASLITDVFEEICTTIKALGHDAYNQLVLKVLPSLIGAFSVADLTEENSLRVLAAELLSLLTEHAATPLPPSFEQAVLPKLLPVLFSSSDSDLLKSCTSSLRYTLQHSPSMLTWHDPSNNGPTAHKSGLECTLLVIDRLLSPEIEDDAAVKVGNLASELVAAVGNTEQLRPYLTQLLQAVAVRLASAAEAPLIQSLILVFARLSLTSARDVLDFLAQMTIGGANGLAVLLPKWLENAPDFAGFDDIRTNAVALARIYELNDPRFQSVICKGELIVEKETSGRIMTRSRAKAMPERWTEVTADVKIIKVLVAELSAQIASGGAALGMGVASSANNGGEAKADDDDFDDDDEDDDGDWEDEPGTSVLDLGLGMTKADLMGLGGEEGSFRVRQADDETQAFLVEFFRRQARENQAAFHAVYGKLSEDQQGKLNGLA